MEMEREKAEFLCVKDRVVKKRALGGLGLRKKFEKVKDRWRGGGVEVVQNWS